MSHEEQRRVNAFAFLRYQGNLDSAAAIILSTSAYTAYFDNRQDRNAFHEELAQYYVQEPAPCNNIVKYFDRYREDVNEYLPHVHVQLLEQVFDGAANNYGTELLQEKVKVLEREFFLQLGRGFSPGTENFTHQTLGTLTAQAKLYQPQFTQLERALEAERYQEVAEIYAILRISFL